MGVAEGVVQEWCRTDSATPCTVGVAEGVVQDRFYHTHGRHHTRVWWSLFWVILHVFHNSFAVFT